QERYDVVVAWNDTTAVLAGEPTVPEMFAAQVARTPDAPAVTFEDQTITYRELDVRANRLAHRLRRRGVGTDVLVGVCLERSIEMVVSLLGILKAGGAYIPLDPDYPPDRLRYMADDSRVAVVLTAPGLDLPWDTSRVSVLTVGDEASDVPA